MVVATAAARGSALQVSNPSCQFHQLSRQHWAQAGVSKQAAGAVHTEVYIPSSVCHAGGLWEGHAPLCSPVNQGCQESQGH